MSHVDQIEAGIWLTQVALEEYDVRGALIVGDTRAVVWDTLSRPRDMLPFVPLIGERELVIVYSHADWDRVWGTAGLPYAGARIVAHDLAGVRFGTEVPGTLAENGAADRVGGPADRLLSRDAREQPALAGALFLD